jgi:hypothetical protein
MHNKQCAGHGTCDSSSGLCNCTGVYFGPDCALLRCPFSKMNRGNQSLECNGQGRCNRQTGRCECYDTTHKAPDCAKRRCPVYPKYNGLTCNGHGTCNLNTGKCQCHYLWSAYDCSVEAPVL